MSARLEAIGIGLTITGGLLFLWPELTIGALVAFWFVGMLD